MCYYEQADSQATIQRGECGGGDGGGAPAPVGAPPGGPEAWSPKFAVELFLDKSISEGGAELATESSSSPPFLSTQRFLSSSQTIEASLSSGKCT